MWPWTLLLPLHVIVKLHCSHVGSRSSSALNISSGVGEAGKGKGGPEYVEPAS